MTSRDKFLGELNCSSKDDESERNPCWPAAVAEAKGETRSRKESKMLDIVRCASFRPQLRGNKGENDDDD